MKERKVKNEIQKNKNRDKERLKQTQKDKQKQRGKEHTWKDSDMCDRCRN